MLESGAVVGGLAWALLTLGGLGQALLVSAVVPDLDLLARMLAAAAGAGSGLALTAAVLGSVAAGARRLADDGGWVALRAMGAGGRSLLGPVLVLLLVGAGGTLLLAHLGEPAARAALRDARVTAAARIRPVEGRTVRLGDWAATLDGTRLRFAAGEWLGFAERWEIRPALAGVVVALEDGEVVGTDGATRARFDTLELPVPLGAAAGRPHISERTTPDLTRSWASTPRPPGRYERWILWKRTILPLCLPLFALALLPLGLGRRWPPLALAGAQLLSMWAVVRLADAWSRQVGPEGAAALTVGVALAWPAVAWARWRDV
jgi:lipopolysaccharide export LptBFGC system permease protein LptF